MTLTDASALVALIDSDEPDHERCVAVLSSLRGPLVTTWPGFTEAMYLLGRAGGWAAQEALWRLIRRQTLKIAEMPTSEVNRTFALMEKYRGVPMALADATLVTLAESLEQQRIFTLDSDFQIYRLHGRVPFEIVP